jgi:uncharacterized protein
MTAKLTMASSLVCVLALSVPALLAPVPVKAASFDCGKADTATEIAICGDSSLGRLDEQIAELYAGLRSASVSSERSKLLKAQRRFLQNRNSCGGIASCLRNRYESRIADLCNLASVKGLALAETTCHDQGEKFADPYSYCKAVGTINGPDDRYVGPKEPVEFREAFGLSEKSGWVEWRCMDGGVYACGTGNSPICGKLSPYDSIEAIREACRREPNTDILSAAVTGRFPTKWVCRNGKPYIDTGDFRTDKQGYPVGYWKFMWPPS